MKAYQMWESCKEGVGDCSLSYWQELHEDLFSKCLHETGMTFSDERLIVSVEVKVVYPRDEEAGTKVLALSIIFGLSSKTQWLSGLYYADFISFYSPTQLCGGGTTKSNSNELPISVPLSFYFKERLTFL